MRETDLGGEKLRNDSDPDRHDKEDVRYSNRKVAWKLWKKIKFNLKP